MMFDFNKYINVYKLLSGRVATNIADSLFYMAILWYFKEVTNSPLMVSIIFAITTGIDMVSFGFGPFIDRVSIKVLLKSATLFQMLISILITVILIWNISNLLIDFLLLVLFMCSIILSSIIYPAEYKLLPLFVSESDLLRFNGLFQLTYKVLDMILDAGVTIVVAMTSIHYTLVLSIIVFAIALYLYSTLNVNALAKDILEDDEYFTGSYLRDLLVGWKTLRDENTILELILPICIINFFYGIFAVGLPYFAQAFVRNSAVGYGALLFAASIGGILGTLLVQRFKIGKQDMQIFVAICFLGAGIFRILVPLSVNMNIMILLIESAISSAWITMMNVNFEALVQVSFDPSVLGRIQTINESLLSIMIPIGSLAGGMIVRSFGSLITQYIYGIALIVSALYYSLIILKKQLVDD